jgi:hypothetical protein
MPNFELAGGTTAGELLRDGRGLLLDFQTNPALGAWASGYGSQLHYAAGPAQNPLGLSALLVRPDGIVAWATDQEPDVPELQQVASRWFGEPAG